jgi:hypothetical protein
MFYLLQYMNFHLMTGFRISKLRTKILMRTERARECYKVAAQLHSFSSSVLTYLKQLTQTWQGAAFCHPITKKQTLINSSICQWQLPVCESNWCWSFNLWH